MKGGGFAKQKQQFAKQSNSTTRQKWNKGKMIFGKKEPLILNEKYSSTADQIYDFKGQLKTVVKFGHWVQCQHCTIVKENVFKIVIINFSWLRYIS